MGLENLPDLDSPAAWDPALVLTTLTGKKIFLLVAFAVLAVSALAGTLPARRLGSLHPPAKAYLGDIPYTFSKLGTSSSASPRGRSSPITIIREFPSVEILKTHLDTSSREPSWSREWDEVTSSCAFHSIL